MTHDRNTIAIGIDLGGTDIKGGLIAGDGRVLTRRSIATEADRGPDHVLDRIGGLICELKNENSGGTVSIAGVGSPGILSHREGIVIHPPNLPGWSNVPLVERLAAQTGLTVSLDNDANCAATAEYAVGAGRGCRDMVLLTLGTGVGSGIILDGHLLRGSHEQAGELGHSIIRVGGRRCNCGQQGCLEAYASASATAARATEAMDAGESSSLGAVRSGRGVINAADVAEAADAGDALAVRIWLDTCRYLAVACVNLCHTVDPERIILSGGMSAAGDRLLSPLLAAFDEQAAEMITRRPVIRLAELGNDAGFVGAALAALGTDR